MESNFYDIKLWGVMKCSKNSDFCHSCTTLGEYTKITELHILKGEVHGYTNYPPNKIIKKTEGKRTLMASQMPCNQRLESITNMMEKDTESLFKS